MSGKKFETYVCNYCGHDDEISSWGSVYWNQNKQSWDAGEINGDDYCSNCQGETSATWLTPTDFPERKGTRKAILVDDNFVEAEGLCETNLQIVSSNGHRYYISNPVEADKIAGTLVVLRKVNKWQWEILEEPHDGTEDTSSTAGSATSE